VRVTVSPDARPFADGACAGWLDDYLGPKITGRAKLYCPVNTGALRESIAQSMDGTTLVVSAVGGAGGREYAAYIELGHRVFHPFTGETGPEWAVARPFLRPALFYGFWHGPVGAMMPRLWTRPWVPEFGFGGDIRGLGEGAKPRQARA
jgi:hypothetical protein